MPRAIFPPLICQGLNNEHVRGRVMRISEAERESEHEIAARKHSDEIASLVSGADSSSDLEVRQELGISHLSYFFQSLVLLPKLCSPRWRCRPTTRRRT